MSTLSLDLRVRILAAYDEGKSTGEEVARCFRVSLGMVKKLLSQRQRTGDIAPRHRFSGRRPRLVGTHRRALRAALKKQPDLTLRELRETAALECSLPAIHYTLQAMGLTYKKRRSGRANKTVPTSPKRAAPGGAGKPALTRRGAASACTPVRRPATGARRR